MSRLLISMLLITSVQFAEVRGQSSYGRLPSPVSVSTWDAISGELRSRFPPISADTLGTEAYRVLHIDLEANWTIVGQGKDLWHVQLNTGRVVDQLRGHTDRVTCVATSRGKKQALSGSLDGTAILWDLSSGDALKTLSGHQAGITSLDFSEDGNLGVTGSRDGTAILWDSNTGKALQTFRMKPALLSWVLDVALSPDGQFAALALSDETAVVWDLTSGRTRHILKGHTDFIAGVAISPDSRLVATTSLDETCRVWDVATGEVLAVLRGQGDGMLSAVFSPNGEHIATCTSSNVVQNWKIATAQPIQDMVGAPWASTSLTMNDQGDRVVFVGPGIPEEQPQQKPEQQIEETGPQVLKAQQQRVRDITTSTDHQFVLAGSDDRTAVLWDRQRSLLFRTLRVDAEITAVDMTPDVRVAVTASGQTNGELTLWDLRSGNRLRNILEPGCKYLDLELSPDAKFITTVSSQAITRWDATTGEPVQKFSLPRPQQRGSLASHASRAITADESTLRVWNLSGDTEVRAFPIDQEIADLAMSSDGKHAVTGLLDGRVLLWDLESGQVIRRLRGQGKSVSCVAFSPDGDRIVSGSGDGHVVVWDWNLGCQIARFAVSKQSITSVAFSGDDHFVLAGSSSGSTLVWDLAKTKPLHLGPSSRLSVLAMTHDGKFACLVDFDGTLTLWNLALALPIQSISLEGPFQAVTFSADGRQLLIGHQHDFVLWDRESACVIHKLSGHRARAHAAAFAPDGRTAMTTSDDGVIAYWDLTTGQAIRTLFGRSFRSWKLAISPDGKIGLAYTKREAIAWDLSSGRLLKIHKKERVFGHRFDAGLPRIYLRDSHGVSVRDLLTGETVQKFPDPQYEGVPESLIAGGRLGLVGGRDGVEVHELATGQLVRKLPAEAGGFRWIVSSDGGLLLLWGPKELSLWNLETGERLSPEP